MSPLDKYISMGVLAISILETAFFVFEAGLAKYQLVTSLLLFGCSFLIYRVLQHGLVISSGEAILKSEDRAKFYRTVALALLIYVIFVIMSFALHIQELNKAHKTSLIQYITRHI